MIETNWAVDEPDFDDALSPRDQPVLVSLHFLRAALHRRRRFWSGFAVAGMLLALGYGLGVPAQAKGTETILLAHNPGTDPNLAMATDVSMLGTRRVAQSVIDQLGLQMTAEQLQATVKATAVTTQVLVVNIAAPTASEAVRRATALSHAFLVFRTHQFEAQTAQVVGGYRSQIAGLQKQVNALTGRYNLLSAQGAVGQAQAAPLLTQRSQLNAQISSIQQTMQSTTLQTSSILDGSHVLDPAALVPASAAKRLILLIASGLIGGTAIGMMIVVFSALTTDRLRRREDIAAALDRPVRVSVGNLSSSRLRTPRQSRSRLRRLGVLVSTISDQLEPAPPPPVTPARKGARVAPPEPARLIVASTDQPEVAEQVVARVAEQVAERGRKVFLVDLTAAGRLTKVLARTGGEKALMVFRPEGMPSIARGPLGAYPGSAVSLPEEGPMRAAWDSAEVVITLADADPAMGADHLTSWARQAVLIVSAGHSSAERLRTISRLFAAAQLELPFALLVGAHSTDESVGLVPIEAT